MFLARMPVGKPCGKGRLRAPEAAGPIKRRGPVPAGTDLSG